MATFAATSLDARLDEVRRLVDRFAADPPATKLDLKRGLARELAHDPDPEVLQAFAVLSELTDGAGRDLVSRAIATHLALEISLAEAFGAAMLDRDGLRRCVAWIPSLIALSRDEAARSGAALSSVDRLERDAVRKVRNALAVPEATLLAAGVVVPEVDRLATAVQLGCLSEHAPSLDGDEAELIAVAAREGDEVRRPNREVVDAIALRTLSERTLAAWIALPPEDPEDAAAAETRRALQESLEAARAAHDVISPRLDALRSRRFQETRAASPRLDRVRGRLFAAYLEVKRALAGGPLEAPEGFHDEIRAAERAAASIDEQREKTQALMREAAAPAGEPVPAVEIAPDVRDLVRERRRKRFLVGVAAALVPVALATNVFFGSWNWKKEPSPGDALAKVMPLQEVVPLPGVLYSQVSSLLWEAMGESERRAKVAELGTIARRQGFTMLLLVDETRRELARASFDGGVEILDRAQPE